MAGDLLWYPVKGEPTIRLAPDALVALGRPKGHRGSYRQWEEDDVAPQVVFEVWSPGYRFADFARKLIFYGRYGVQEFYLYDPDRLDLAGWARRDGSLHLIEGMEAHVSPLLGVRFEMGPSGLAMFRPDGTRFLTFAELEAARQEAERRAAALEAELAALRARPTPPG